LKLLKICCSGKPTAKAYKRWTAADGDLTPDTNEDASLFWFFVLGSFYVYLRLSCAINMCGWCVHE